jgi:glucose/arabinose dehydrogenase
MNPKDLARFGVGLVLAAGALGCSTRGALGSAGAAGAAAGAAGAAAGSAGASAGTAGAAAGATGTGGASGSAGATGADGGAADTTGAAGAASADAPAWCGRGLDVPGAQAASGFCLKSYAQISEARALVFAPNGDLFVSSPSESAPGGASGGTGTIFLLSDDNHDGVAETHVFLSALDAKGTKPTEVHGLALGGGYLYFTTKATVWRTPYADGQRMATGTPEDLGLPLTYGTGGRWTHGLARSAGGTLYTSRGGYASCGDAAPAGDVGTVGAGGALTLVAKGFRNPMYLRCHRTDEVCAAMELGEDLQSGATEKMLRLRPSTDYGFPCCNSTGLPGPDATAANTPNMCNDITKEDASFPLSDTPFGFDWEPGKWGAPFTNAVFVALHGSAYSTPPWKGANVVYAPTDPKTRMPTQDWTPFQGGWTVGGTVLDRPADIAFSADGRMFIADDMSGNVFWMAPTTLAAPAN